MCFGEEDGPAGASKDFYADGNRVEASTVCRQLPLSCHVNLICVTTTKSEPRFGIQYSTYCMSSVCVMQCKSNNGQIGCRIFAVQSRMWGKVQTLHLALLGFVTFTRSILPHQK